MTDRSNPSGRVAFGRAAFGRGVRESIGTPAVMLAASYLGFGSLVRTSELSLALGLTSTLTGWALPGQIVLVELYALGATVTVIAIAVALTNARLFPMTLALMPRMHEPGTPRWRYYAAAHLIAVTGWVQCMQRFPELRQAERLPYMVGFSGALLVVSLTATAVGYLLAGDVPPAVSLGLVFVNPVYFLLVLSTGITARSHALALAFGAVIGPVLHVVSPDWGLLATGVIAGTAAFAIGRRRPGDRHG